MPSVLRTKRRPSITKRAKIIAGICAAIAVLLVFGGLIFKQQERLAANAAEAATYTPAAVAPGTTSSSEAAATGSGEPEKLQVVRREGEPLRTLFAGDSLTGGLSADVETEGFKWLMLNELEKTGPVEEYNSNLSGGTTLQVSERYEVPAGLDLAVVELGTNDLSTPITEFTDAYQSLIDRIVGGSPEVKLVCAGVWEGGGGSPEALQYDQVIRNICTANGGRFVPLRPIYTNFREVIGPVGAPAFGGVADDFHPNSAGHEAIAAALLSVIEAK